MSLVITFIIFNILNVIIQTVKSICTIKCNKYVASVVNAVAYGLYTYIIVLTNADLDLWIKVVVVALANLVGVFVVKYFEEKNRKDKLWQLSITISNKDIEKLHLDYKNDNISHNYIVVDKWGIFTVYCETQKETTKAIEVAKKYNAKMFATENRLAL